jgi:hypothetical protein
MIMKKLFSILLGLVAIGTLGASAYLLLPDKPARSYIGAASSALVNDIDDLFAKTATVVPITRMGAATTASAADNTTAINAAVALLTAGEELFVPTGTFEVNSITFGSTAYKLRVAGVLSCNEALSIPANVAVVVEPGGLFDRVAGANLIINGQFGAGMQQVFDDNTTTLDWVAFGSGFIGWAIPQWWGAVGNGVADDTVAIQKSINASLRVEIPYATYAVDPTRKQLITGTATEDIRMKAGLEVRSGQIVRGNGRPTLQAIANACFGYSIIHVPDNVSHATVEGIRFIGDRDTHNYAPVPNTYPTHEYCCGVMPRGSHYTIKDCYFEAFPGDGITVYNRYLRSHVDYDSKCGGKIVGCHIYDNRRQGISVVDCGDLLIHKCLVENTGITAYPAPGYAIDMEGEVSGGVRYHSPDGVTITDCTFRGCIEGKGVYQYNGKNTRVSNCFFDGVNFNYGYSEDTVVSNCTFDARDSTTLIVVTSVGKSSASTATNWVLSGCTLRGGKWAYILGADGMKISGNIFYAQDDIGLSIHSSSYDVIVSDNTFENLNGAATGSGVVVAGPQTRLIGNRFNDIKADAITTSVAGTEIIGNSFYSCYRGVQASQAALIKNNVFQQAGRAGGSASIYTYGATHSIIDSNLFYASAQSDFVTYSASVRPMIVNNQFIAFTSTSPIAASNGSLIIEGNNFISARTGAGGAAVSLTGGSAHRIIGNRFSEIGGIALTTAITTSATTGSNIIRENVLLTGVLTSHASDTVLNNVVGTTQYPAQANPVLIGTISATGNAYVYGANKAVVVEKVQLISSATVAKSDTHYWSAQIANLTQSNNLLSAAKTTMDTGGTAITANVAWDLVPDQNATLAQGDVLQIQFTKTDTPDNIATALVMVHVRPAQ